MKKKRIVIGVIIAAAAAGAIFWAVRHFGGSGDAVYVQSVAELNYATSGGYQNRFSGVVEPQQTQEVAFVAGSTLEEIYVEEGDEVSIGDKLFAYDTAALKLAIQQADLELEQLRTTITTSKSQIAELQKEEKTAKGADKASLSAQIQSLQVEVSQAEYDIKTKEAEKTRLGKDLNEAVVKAEIDGTVDSIAELKTESDGTSSVVDPTESGSDTYITILANGNYRVKGTISEQNYSEFYEGLPVIIRSRVDDSVTWKGTISSIASQPAEENQNNYYYEEGSGESASKYNFFVALEETGDLLMGQHVTVEADLSSGEVKTGIWIDEGYLVFEGEENTGDDSVIEGENTGDDSVIEGEDSSTPEDWNGETDGDWSYDPEASDGEDRYDQEGDSGEYYDMAGEDSVDDMFAETGDSLTDTELDSDGNTGDVTEDGMTDRDVPSDGMTGEDGELSGETEQEVVSGTAYVWATSEPGGRLEKRQVTLGNYDENLCAYHILEGLEETDYIAWPDSSLRPGMRTTTEMPSDDGEMDGSVMPGGETGYDGEMDGSVMPGGEMGYDGAVTGDDMYSEEGVSDGDEGYDGGSDDETADEDDGYDGAIISGGGINDSAMDSQSRAE